MFDTEPRLYAYAIVRLRNGDPSPAPMDGVGGRPVRTISRGGLAALISDLTPQGGTTISDALRDPSVVKDMVLDHHRVLQSMVEQCTVLPLRFGAVFASDDSVEAELDAHREALCEALERIDGACEWGVKIFGDRAILRSRPAEETPALRAALRNRSSAKWLSPAIRAARQQIAATTEGRAFFLRRKLEEIAEEEVERAIGHCIANSRRLLTSTARAAATLKTQPQAIHGRTDEMVWNGAYLVSKDREDRFFECIAALKQAHGPSGFDYECTGPWPPSSFAECRIGASDGP